MDKFLTRKLFIQDFKNTSWEDVMTEMNVDVATSTLESKICQILDKFAPMKVVQARNRYRSWLSNETKLEMQSRDSARMEAKLNDCDENWAIFRSLRNNCTKLQKNDKKVYLDNLYKRIEDEKDVKKLFSETRNLLGWKQLGGPTCFKIDGEIIRKEKMLADCQADYYVEKLTKIKNELPKVNMDPLAILKRIFGRWQPPGGMPSFSLKCVTHKEVGAMIRNLKDSHAYGIDNIDAFTLKLVAGTLIPPITHVINLSLGTSNFPARWKLSRILPLKKGRESESTAPKSYRPVSQLPVISKLAERTVQRQILTYLEDNRMISQHHHGYRDHHNTATALIELMDSIATGTDGNEITATMSMDLSAAFDCVPHGTLIEKLEYYGLDTTTKNWLKSYLQHRSSFVSIGNAKSKIYPTLQGVPQGSVLGPLLYLLFVNEITGIVEDPDCPNEVHRNTENLFSRDCKLCGFFPMYADDGQLQITSKNRNYNQDTIEKNFWKIIFFLNANGLMVNENKTKLTEFMSYQKRTKIGGIPPDLTVQELVTNKNGVQKLEDKHIMDSDQCRMLGLTMRNNLNWNYHLNNGKNALLPNLRKQIGNISRISSNMSKKARLNLDECLSFKQNQLHDMLMGQYKPYTSTESTGST